ncbi:hypothetical protein DM02DRAFT_596917 [Periconia macrospinosa]|uniref:Uncharacterized protein n=1 Tax=Periconia macrospinosa TaxID=97972 RepID=A0A2V1DI76_9PLEO|nr:hypothetical protein DM02DRAFT_596917 [Periconia macrospinosa]
MNNSIPSTTPGLDGPGSYILVAQNVMCAYPISDLYAPTPRYLYYTLLALAFGTLRHQWISHMFLGGAVAYAATAAIHAIIIASRPAKVAPPAVVAIPYIQQTSNLTRVISSLVTNTSNVLVQPDAVELDIDPIMAVVVTAYLVGLPLQLWSRTMRSSNITRYLLILWNLSMLVGTICALVSWPNTNLAAPQYRFCYSGFLDPSQQNSDGWDTSLWRGTWNATVATVFNKDDNSAWLGLSNNCFYPCFNTSQTLRQSSSLKAVVMDGKTTFAKLHSPSRRSRGDDIQPLVYVAIVAFTAAQFFLILVSGLRLCSDVIREAIHEPHRVWRMKNKIWHQTNRDVRRGWLTVKATVLRRPIQTERDRISEAEAKEATGSRAYTFRSRELLIFPRLILDGLAMLTLMAGLCISGPLVVAFTCWVEWYIRNDGASNETIKQVGQWSTLVSIAVVLLATVARQFLKDRLSSAEEVRTEILTTEAHLQKLRTRLRHLEEITEKKNCNVADRSKAETDQTIIRKDIHG